jgi:hypothetical protein
MKKLTALFLSAFAAFALAFAGPGDMATALHLVWEPDPLNDARGGVDVTCVYWSTNVSTPLTNWVKVATVPGTTNKWQITNVSILSGPHFYFVTASNVTGESRPSNVACLPAPPSSDRNLEVRRGL